jgi:hypothetical protein
MNPFFQTLFCKGHSTPGGPQFCVFCLRLMADRGRELLERLDERRKKRDGRSVKRAVKKLRESLEPEEVRLKGNQ